MKPRSRVAKAVLALLLVGAIALPALVFADQSTNKNEFQYAVALWGDFPYSDIQAQTGVPNLIADINSQNVAFSVHDGDLKAGNWIKDSKSPTSCENALYAQGLAYLNQLEQPAMFTPGDNDWTDCDRPANGGFNSLERLDYERALFFSTPYSQGKRQMRQQVQTAPTCLGYVSGPSIGPTITKSVPCVENRRWSYRGVVYATINIQGSCNNLCDTYPDPDEFAARNAAGIAWLKETFAEAKASKAVAVMIIGQADPGFDLSDSTRAPIRDPKTLAETDASSGPLDGYVAFLTEFRDQIVAFQRPVVYVHGDSHYFRVDKPLLDAKGRRVENFTRVETYGDNAPNDNNDVNWVKVLVDPNSRDVFAFQPQVVPGNRLAVPAPTVQPDRDYD